MIESQIESLNFIGGEWVPANSGETSEVVNPSYPSEVLGTTPKSGEGKTGPVVNESQYEGILRALETAGDQGRMVLEEGATGSEQGYFISPAIVADADNESETAQEEIFGPVLAVIRARDFDHAVESANGTRYGLSAGIATRSLRYAHEFAQRSDAGMISVSLPTAGVEFQAPFGGNKESGVGGREQGQAALDFYSTWKTVAIRTV